MKRARFSYGILLLLVMIVTAGMLGWSLLSRGFSARDQPGAAEAYVARGIRHFSVPRKWRATKNPVEFGPTVLSAAMEHFADHCAICHGNDGKGKTLLGKGLYPKPPDMTLETTQQLTDGELYYIIENGVRLTGMPAFGEGTGNEPSEESWALVHFIRHLPNLSVEEQEAMKAMNPKSPAEIAKEERLRKFLEGDDSPIPATNHDHQHKGE